MKYIRITANPLQMGGVPCHSWATHSGGDGGWHGGRGHDTGEILEALQFAAEAVREREQR